MFFVAVNPVSDGPFAFDARQQARGPKTFFFAMPWSGLISEDTLTVRASVVWLEALDEVAKDYIDVRVRLIEPGEPLVPDTITITLRPPEPD